MDREAGSRLSWSHTTRSWSPAAICLRGWYSQCRQAQANPKTPGKPETLYGGVAAELVVHHPQVVARRHLPAGVAQPKQAGSGKPYKPKPKIQYMQTPNQIKSLEVGVCMQTPNQIKSLEVGVCMQEVDT